MNNTTWKSLNSLLQQEQRNAVKVLLKVLKFRDLTFRSNDTGHFCMDWFIRPSELAGMWPRSWHIFIAEHEFSDEMAAEAGHWAAWGWSRDECNRIDASAECSLFLLFETEEVFSSICAATSIALNRCVLLELNIYCVVKDFSICAHCSVLVVFCLGFIFHA